MTKIYSPNKEYTGVVAGVPFNKGKGETEDKWLINWFKEKGYKIEVEKPKKPEETEEEKKLREIAEAETKAKLEEKKAALAKAKAEKEKAAALAKEEEKKEDKKDSN